MNRSGVPWRYRLETRQSIPIMVGLAGVLAFMLSLGYLQAREQILASARSQVAQLVGAITRQDDYTRSWLTRGMQPLVRQVATFPRLNAREQQAADTRLTSAISDKRGHQIVAVYLLDADGMVTVRRYDSKRLLEAGPAPAEEWTRQRILEFRSARWAPPEVDANRNLMLRYSVPVTATDETGKETPIGICSVNLAISWFADRVRSFSPFRNCDVFFLTRKGAWTLPPQDDVPLARLRANMLAQPSGESSITWKHKPYTAVYMPIAGNELRLGLLIPREDLFGDLDRLTHLLGVIGLVVLVLAAYSLHRTSKTLLSPLAPLGQLAARLARGEFDVDPQTPAPGPATRFPDEARRLRQATETLRQALHQRVQDLTLIGRTRERLFGEMTFARSMQEAMRPQQLPPTPGLEVAAFVHTAGDVCGDMYDSFFQSPRRLCCVMGNAAAHGVPAALLTSRVIPLLHELLLSGFAPGNALEYGNSVLGPSASREQHMVSVFVGILDLDVGTFCWACAGHAPPFRSLGQDVGQLEWTGNMPLGIRDKQRYPERTIRLRPGETLLFAGPRLLAVQDAQGDAFGEQALRTFLAKHGEAPVDLVRALYTRVHDHAGGPPQDDLTFFAVRWGKDDAGCQAENRVAPGGEAPTPAAT